MGKQSIPVACLIDHVNRLGAERYSEMINGIGSLDVGVIQQLRLRTEPCIKICWYCRVGDEGNCVEIVWIASLLCLNVFQKAAVKPLKTMNAQGEQLRSEIEKPFQDLLALRCHGEAMAKFGDRAGKRRQVCRLPRISQVRRQDVQNTVKSRNRQGLPFSIPVILPRW